MPRCASRRDQPAEDVGGGARVGQRAVRRCRARPEEPGQRAQLAVWHLVRVHQLPGQHDGVQYGEPRPGQAALGARGSQEAHVEGRVVRDQHAAVGEGEQARQDRRELRGRGQHLVADPGQVLDARRHRDTRVDQRGELALRRPPRTLTAAISVMPAAPGDQPVVSRSITANSSSVSSTSVSSTSSAGSAAVSSAGCRDAGCRDAGSSPAGSSSRAITVGLVTHITVDLLTDILIPRAATFPGLSVMSRPPCAWKCQWAPLACVCPIRQRKWRRHDDRLRSLPYVRDPMTGNALLRSRKHET